MAKDCEPKLNSLRGLKQRGMEYEVILYPESIKIAVAVAQHIGLPAHEVFKTLVVSGSGCKTPLLALVASDRELDLKILARAADIKRVRMLPQRDAEQMTGLKVGGISALALLAKGWPVYLDSAATALESIVMNAGRRGVQVRLGYSNFVELTAATVASISSPAGS